MKNTGKITTSSYPTIFPRRIAMFLALALSFCCLAIGEGSGPSTLMTGERRRYLRPNKGKNGNGNGKGNVKANGNSKANGNGNGNGTGNRPEVCPLAEKYQVVVIGAGWSGITTAKLLKDYAGDSGRGISDFNFTVLEKNPRWDLIGRGIAARYVMGGQLNPVASIMVDQMVDQGKILDEHKKDVRVLSVYDASKADYYDTSGQLVTGSITGTLEDFMDAYECLIEKSEALFDAAPGTKDQSMREVLNTPCGWAPPSETSIERSIEYASIDYEFSSTPDIMGMFNFPADRPNKDFATDPSTPSDDWFLVAPLKDEVYASTASIGEWYVGNHSLGQNISSGTGVAKIYWDNDDGSRYPILIKTEGKECYDILANRVIFTPSIGLLEHRGDCLHAEGSTGPEGCDPNIESLPMFDPVVPFMKMEAIRRAFIDTTRPDTKPYPSKRAGMTDYVEIRFQFNESFWSSSSTKDYLIFEDEDGCRMWQNHDGRFYENSMALSCTVNSDKLDQIADANTKQISPKNVQKLYEKSLGLLDGAPETCVEITNTTWYPGNMTEIKDRDTACGYSYFPSWTENQTVDDYDDWYGSYVTWNVGPKSLSWLEQDFKDYTEPLRSNGVDRVYISGTGVCDRHQGWVQGAVYAAIKVTKQMLGDIDPGYDTTSDPKWVQYCDLGPNKEY